MNKTTIKTVLALALLILTGMAPKAYSQVIHLGFESDTFKSIASTVFWPDYWRRYMWVGAAGSTCSPEQIAGIATVQTSTDVVRAGNKSGKCILDVSNGGVAHKAMFRTDFIEEGTLPQFTKQELWFKFSFYLPDTGALAWVSDSVADLIFQLFKDEVSPDGDAAGPEMALGCENDTFSLDYRFSDLPPHSTSAPANPGVKVRTAWKGTLPKGVWIDLVFHMKYSPLTPHGFLEVWKQEDLGGFVKIVDLHSERIGFPSDLRTNLDLGIYKAKWKCPQTSPVKTRLIYYDEYAVGDSTASFEAMTGIPEPYPQFTAGNLAVLRYGNGFTSIGSSITVPVYIDEYTPAGVKIKSIEMPNLAKGINLRLTALGSATTEGLTNLSPDGQYLTVVGYDADPGTKLDSLTNTKRVVAIVQGDRSVNTSTSLPATDIPRIRSAATTDGNDIWVLSNASSNSIYYTTLGSSTGTMLTSAAGARNIQIANNNLYLATGGTPLRILKDAVTGGMPYSGTPTVVPYTLAASANQYAIFDVNPAIAGPDLIYTASDAAGAVYKYIFNGSNWVSQGSVAVTGITTNIKSITGSITDSVVTLYGVSIDNNGSATGSPSGLFSVVDNNFTSSFTTTPPAVTAIADAPAKTIFKSVTFAPVALSALRKANNKVVRTALLNVETDQPVTKLAVYPNPSSDQINILYPTGQSYTHWKIVDLMGRVVLQAPVGKGTGITQINIASLKSGVYLVLAEGKKGKQTVRFVKP